MTLWRSCFIGSGWPLAAMARVSGRPLNKPLAGPLSAGRTVPCYFQFDSLARVCFLFGSQIRRTSNARSFQVEQQMVAGRDSAGCFLADCGLDEYRAGGIRPRRAQHRGARRTPCSTRGRSKSPAATSPLRRTPSRKQDAATRWRRCKPSRACGGSMTKRGSLPEAKPFVWSAERDVVRVTLGGSCAVTGEQEQAARHGARSPRRASRSSTR